MERNRLIEISFCYSKTAEKFFNKHEDIRKKFKGNIERLLMGESIDIKELSGYKNVYRNRIGKYRVIYTVINGRLTVVNVLAAGSRGDVYKHMKNSI